MSYQLDKFQEIADKIKSRTGDTTVKPSQFAEKVEEVYNLGYSDGHGSGYDDGKKAEYDEFWDNYFDNGGDFKKAFANNCWNDENYNPPSNIVCTASAESMFQDNAKITDTKVFIEVRGCTANYMFTGCTNIKTIRVGFFNNTSNSSFGAGCTALENLIIAGEIQYGIGLSNSSKLTAESLQNLVDHLKDLTGQSSAKLALHATAGARLTEEQKNTIIAKNWTVAY